MLEPTPPAGRASAFALTASPSNPWRVRLFGLYERVTRARPLAWLLRFAVAALALTIARATLGDEYLVPTGSMWPTITPGDRIFVSKTAYGLKIPFVERYLVESKGPSVGDIVVFADPRGGPTLLVKRVVATAGQRVSLKRGVLYVDGRPQKLERDDDGRLIEHLGEVTHDAGRCDGDDDYGPTVVPPAHFFVMGDNRAVSLDSRAMGPIPRHMLRGRVLGAVLHIGEQGIDWGKLLRSIR